MNIETTQNLRKITKDQGGWEKMIQWQEFHQKADIDIKR